ncbi:hypothetical protein DH2020_007255 [Rehmannia glutinosa]|uniref:Pectinesterase inhibitor domain-containing protein n=1 Tax=Rehmannia glutinosa TaxID=99300 RepID=A0ABR0TYG3_REHGL
MKISSYIPLLSLFVVSSLLSPSSCDETTDLINQICRNTADFGFCNNILNRNLISPKTDFVGLTKLTINLALSFANDTDIFIQKSEAAEKDPKLKQLYAGCDSNYQKVVGFMRGAQYDVNRADYKSMVELLQLCSRPVIDCQNALGDIVFEVREKNRRMRVFLTMGLYEGGQL